MTKNYWRLMFGLAVLTSSAQAEIVLGLAAPLTGDQAVFGAMMQRGFDAAVKDVNAAGGIKGEHIRTVTFDDRCDPKEAVNVASAMINEGVRGVVGHFCSAASIPASDLYAESGILQISPGSTAPKLTQRGISTLFRVCGRDDAQGAVAAEHLIAQSGAGRIAVIDDNSTYGKGLVKSFLAGVNAGGAGGRVALQETVTAGDKDFSVVVTKMRAAGISIVYYGGYHPELSLLLRQSERAGLEPIFYAGDAMGTDELSTIAGKAAERVFFTQGSYPELPALIKMRAAEEAQGRNLEVYTVYSYAAVQALQTALTAADQPLKQALALKNQSIDTLIGTIAFDEKGDIKNPIFALYTFRNGRITPLEKAEEQAKN